MMSRAGWSILSLAILLGTLWWDAIERSDAHLTSGKELEKAGDLERAVRHYQWAARAFALGTTAGYRALEELQRIAQSQEQIHPEFALFTYDLMRGAIRSTDGITRPYDMWRQSTDEAIVRLRGTSQTTSNLHEVLAYDPRPSAWRSIALVVSLIAVLVSVVRLITLGFTSELTMTSKANALILQLAYALIAVIVSLW